MSDYPSISLDLHHFGVLVRVPASVSKNLKIAFLETPEFLDDLT